MTSRHSPCKKKTVTQNKTEEVKVSYNEPANSPASEPEPSSTIIAEESPSVDLSAAIDDLSSHWITIKDQIKTERKWVYSIIKDSGCAKGEKSSIIIHVDDTTYDLADGYKDYLTGKVSKYFGETLSINLVKDSEFISSSSHGERPAGENKPENTESKASPAADNYEKIRGILVSEFDAKETNQPI